MTLHCPTCATTDLILVANKTGRAAVCTRCGGTWLDNVCSRAVVQNLLDEAVKWAAREGHALAAKKSSARPVALRPEGERACPECTTAMKTTRFDDANLVIDVCNLHGTWFDAGELWTMASHFEMKGVDDSAFGKEVASLRNETKAEADLRAAGLVFKILRG